MVSWLEETFQGLAPLQEKAKKLYGDSNGLEERARSNGGGKVEQQMDVHRRELQETVRSIEERIQPVRQRGMVVKSIEHGLVDFPFVREGEVVYLCWRVGETEIGFWHGLASGFADRQPL